MLGDGPTGVSIQNHIFVLTLLRRPDLHKQRAGTVIMAVGTVGGVAQLSRQKA